MSRSPVGLPRRVVVANRRLAKYGYSGNLVGRKLELVEGLRGRLLKGNSCSEHQQPQHGRSDGMLVDSREGLFHVERSL